MAVESPSAQAPLRPGDVVEVRSVAEILSTLDPDASIDYLPFMPEMIQYAGRRFTVTRRVDKICDTIAATGSRRMYDTVYLDDLRCDGSGHDGCQAGCRIYWKEQWLRRVGDSAPSSATTGDAEALARLAAHGTRTERVIKDRPQEVWRCQATEALKASQSLKTSDLGQYWREMTNGNFRRLRFFGLLVRGFVMEIADRIGLLKPLPLHGSGQEPPQQPSPIRPGDLVQVRRPEEIAPTLDAKGLNKGLSFDREMLPYCGRTFRVQDKVERLIDDKTGRMLNVTRDCFILEGVVCSGNRSAGRWFCPREIYAYWRPSWLQRIDAPDSSIRRTESVSD